jgi:hypothetical protein
MPVGCVTVMVADADFVGSVTEVAITRTVLLVGTAAGAKYVVACPAAVDVGVKLPHCTLPQVTDQVTLPLPLSLWTTAVITVVVLAASDDGGWAENATEIGCTGGLLLEPPPQALSHKVNAAMPAREIKLRDFIECLQLGCPGRDSIAIHCGILCAREIHADYEC